MSQRKSSVSNLIHHLSLEESPGFESKLAYIKSQEPRISYSQISLHCEIKSVSITPDEKYAVAGLEDGQVQLINIVTTDEEFESCSILKGHNAEVKCLCVTNDSECVISGSYDKQIIIWDIPNRKQKSILKGSEDKILSMAISKDNTTLVSGSIDNIIRIWDLQVLIQKIVIRSIERNCYAICFTHDINFLILGCSDNMIRIWNISEHREEVKLEGHSWPIYSMALTTDGQYLLSTGMDHTIRKWDMTSFQPVCVLVEGNETIYSLSLTSDNIFVAYGKYNGEIGVIALDGSMKEVAIPCCKSCINSIIVSGSNKYIVSGSIDGTVQISRLSENPEFKILEGHSKRIYCLSVSPDSQIMASCSDDGAIYIWRLGIDDCEGILKGHRGPVHSVLFTNDSHQCISGSQDQTIIIWDLSTESASQILKGHEETVTSLAIDKEDRILISGSIDKTVRIWDLETFSNTYIFRGHLEKVSCLALSSDSSHIVSGSLDKSLRVWNVSEKIFIGKMNAHDEDIKCVCLVNDRMGHASLKKLKRTRSLNVEENVNSAPDEGLSNEKIISGSLDRTIKIWNFYTMELEYVLPCKKEVFMISVTIDFSYMFVLADKKYVSMWSIPDKQELITLYESDECHAMSLSPDKQWLVFSSKNLIQMVKSPLNRESSFTVLPYAYSYLFKVLIYQILNNEKSQKNSIFGKYFVCPYNLSLLHILTYASHSKMLKKAIRDGAKFFSTRSGETPLSIALSRKSKICAELLIKMFAAKNVGENPFIFKYLEDLLPILNKSSLPSLHILYKAAFPVIESLDLPTFGTFISNPPVILMSETTKIDPNLFTLITNNANHNLTDSEIEFRRSLVSIDLCAGSKHCITFMKSLLKCNNDKIFATDFVKSVLKYKWRQIRWVLLTQAWIYVFFILILILHTVYSRTLISLLVLELLINTVFFCYELSQFLSGVKSYLTDVWNMLDALRVLFAYGHAILTLAGGNQEAQDVLLTVLTIATWTRFIGHFRIFDKLRYLIRLIIEVLKDLGPFLLIFVFSNFGATFTFYSNSYGDNFGVILLSTYSISYGGWSGTQNNNLQYVIFFLVSLLNTLILLNLLIALITDTYSRVEAQIEIVDMKELADIVLEVDYITFWTRSKGQKLFLISCNVAGSSKHRTHDNESKVITKIVADLENRSKGNERCLEKISQAVTRFASKNVGSKNEGVIELIVGIKNDFKAFKTEMHAELKQIKHDISSVRTELKVEKK